MCGWIVIGNGAITGTRDDLVSAHHYAADRHLTTLAGAACLIERQVHEGSHCNPSQLRLVRVIHVFIHVRDLSKTGMQERTNQRKAGQRIARVSARAGVASRREAEAWIAAGRVAVNGTTVASPAMDVTDSDHISVDVQPLPARERTRLFLYHKPRGLMTTHA